MKGIAVVALLASLGGACGDGQGDDGMQPTARITITTGRPPTLIVYREETATEWKTPASPNTGTFEFEVTGPYRVILLCGGSTTTVQLTEFAQTLDDDPTIDYSCGGPRELPLHVRGQMQQSGEVAFGGLGLGQSSAPWSFDLPAAAGTFDFLAFFGSFSTGFDRFEIRRDLAIAGDLDLGTIDVAQEPAQALVPTRFTASNLADGETLTSDLFLQSGHTFAVLDQFAHPELAWQVNLVPPAALRANDTQDLQLLAGSSSSDPMQQRLRGVTRRFRDGGSTSVTLMDALGPTAFQSTADRLVASWASLPEHDGIELTRMSFSSDFSRFVVHNLVLSRAFLASTHATTATLDLGDVPGFLPEWRHDPALDQQFTLNVFRGTAPDDTTFSGVSQDLTAPTPGTPPRRADPQRARALLDAHRAELRRVRTATRPGTRCGECAW